MTREEIEVEIPAVTLGGEYLDTRLAEENEAAEGQSLTYASDGSLEVEDKVTESLLEDRQVLSTQDQATDMITVLHTLHEAEIDMIKVQPAPMGAGAVLSAHNIYEATELYLQDNSCILPVAAEQEGGVDLKKGVDGPYAWLVCVLGCMTCMFLFGILTGFGVMLVPIAEDLNVSPADVSWLPTSINAIMVAVGSLTGQLADRLRPSTMLFCSAIVAFFSIGLSSMAGNIWIMAACFSFPMGLVLSCGYLPFLALLAQWFDRYIGLATGIAIAGTGLGTIAFPLAMQSITDNFGWRWAMRSYGIVLVLTLSVSAAVCRRRFAVAGKSRSSITRHLRTYKCWALVVAVFFNSFGYLVPFLYIVPYSAALGLTELEGAIIVSLMGVTSTMGRVGVGFLADRLPRLLLLQSVAVTMSFCVFSWVLCVNFLTIAVFGMVYGAVSGAYWVVLQSLLVQYFGLEVLGSMTGVIYTSSFFTILLGAPVAGYVLQATNSYAYTIFISGTAISVGAMAVLTIPPTYFSPPADQI